jgi:hypothetical protein
MNKIYATSMRYVFHRSTSKVAGYEVNDHSSIPCKDHIDRL